MSNYNNMRANMAQTPANSNEISPKNSSAKKSSAKNLSAKNSPPKNLPMCLEPARPRPSLVRYKVPAQFLSQLIAERNRLATQTSKRRAPVSLATKAYNTARHIAIKRMPTGFNHQTNA